MCLFLWFLGWIDPRPAAAGSGPGREFGWRVTAPPTAPTPPPMRAPVAGRPPVTAATPAPAPAPIRPPVTARVPGSVPQAVNSDSRLTNASPKEILRVMPELL